MKNRKQWIVHISSLDKFIPPFIEIIRSNFHKQAHQFILLNGNAGHVYKNDADIVEAGPNLKSLFLLELSLYRADKIILHSLFDNKIILLLYMQPWLLKKCFWAIWGGDLYSKKSGKKNWRWYVKEFIRRPVIRKMGYLVTYIPGDVELARQWYGAKGAYRECLMYPSNTYKKPEPPKVEHNRTVLLLGNSADPSNNHFKIFTKLAALDDNHFRIICPLSYGDMEYAGTVAEEGVKLFGNRFKPLFDFMPLQDYLQLLAQVDIAVFAHKRQQAMGNIITLLGWGKKVYMRNDVTHYTMFKELDIHVYDISNLGLSPISKHVRKKNITLITDNFSNKLLIKQLQNIWEN